MPNRLVERLLRGGVIHAWEYRLTRQQNLWLLMQMQRFCPDSNLVHRLLPLPLRRSELPVEWTTLAGVKYSTRKLDRLLQHECAGYQALQIVWGQSTDCWWFRLAED